MFEDPNKTYLITTDAFFFAPDGRQYRAVWGKIKCVKSEEVAGFRTTGGANWGVVVGSEDNKLFIAGCQVHYILEAPIWPTSGDVFVVV